MERINEGMLALLLIKTRRFANAYDLCRVLSRIFGLINCSEIIRYVVDEKYVDIEKIEHGVKYFSLTDLGQIALNQAYGALILELKILYKGEHQFIDGLGNE